MAAPGGSGPEQLARQEIDKLLTEAGWIVQSRNEINLGAGHGIAIREFKLTEGFGYADYLLFVDQRAVGALEAKPQGHSLGGVEPQIHKYASGLPATLTAPVLPLPFLYLSTGTDTRFINLLDADPRTRLLVQNHIHRPETIAEWLSASPLSEWVSRWRLGPLPTSGGEGSKPSSLRARLRAMPDVHIPGLWRNKVEAITSLEKSLYDDRPRALIQMATGSGKTLLAITAIYRLIKYGGARRVLFLVDRQNLGEQAEKEFQNYRAPDDSRKFTELYNVQRLTSNTVASSAKVVITTIQRLTGTAQKTVGLKHLRKFAVPVAPFPEQHRIADAIESYLTRLDAAGATLERVKANLKRYRASVLKAAVEGRLVPTEADLARHEGRSYEPASVLLERILKGRRQRWQEIELAKLKAKGEVPGDDLWKKKYEEPVVPDMSTLPELPGGWSWASMDQLAVNITSGSRDWSKYYGRGQATFLMAQNIRPGVLDLSFRQAIDPPLDDPSRSRSRVRRNDLLVTIVGANTGNVCRVPNDLPDHYVCQSVALMRPTLDDLSAYLECYLNSSLGQTIYQEYIYGQGRPHLGFEHLRATPVRLPPLAEQRRIIDTVARLLSGQEATENALLLDQRRCQRLRQSILKWAFDGKLVDQDPTDEPASVLLERIKAERENAGGANHKTPRSGPRKATA